MGITAAQVKALRERTGAGMMECKRALQASDGDIDKAIQAMRKAGQAKADKKATRVAAQGLIVIAQREDNRQAVMLEVNCETDFVARDENFVNFARSVAAVALERNLHDIDVLAQTDVKPGQSVESMRQDLLAKVGENIALRRLIQCEASENHVLGCYVHGGRIGVLVTVRGGDSELAKDVAMHIAASNPQVIIGSDYPDELLQAERAIYIANAEKSGKPPEIVEKIVAGQIAKFLDSISLLGQAFVKNPEIKVAELLNTHGAQVEKFTRFEVGEGIDVETSDFASEVMEQVKGSSSS